MSGSAVSVRERLAAPPTRGLGAASEVAEEAGREPGLLRELLAALEDDRAIVQARAGNALKKLQQRAPTSLDPFARRLLKQAWAATLPETRWNLMLVIAKLPLHAKEQALAVDLMFEAAASHNAFLRVAALQGLFDLSSRHAALEPRLRALLGVAGEDRSAAVRARTRRLLEALQSRMHEDTC